MNRLSLLLPLLAALFFTGVTWALARKGRLDRADGMVLVGLFLFWQCVHVFEVMKNKWFRPETRWEQVDMDKETVLDYPDLPDPRFDVSGSQDRGTAYVPLRQEGDVWVGEPIQRTEPEGLFLRCDDSGWRLECGIESWFVGQSVALELEESVRDQDAIATVRVDRWGNAAIVALTPQDG